MKSNIFLDAKVRQDLQKLLNNQSLDERVGGRRDFSMLLNDAWLQDSAVIENILFRRGQWEVHLVFAHYTNPYKLIKRRITTCFCKEKAQTYAHYMRRQAAKDPRGTLRVDSTLFQFCAN